MKFLLFLILLLPAGGQKTDFSISEEERCKQLRAQLKYNLRPDLPCGEPFVRVTIEEMLEREELFNYSWPFVMTGSITGYEKLKDLDWLVEQFGENIADFYPFNELDHDNHPMYLYRFKAGVEEFKKMPGEGVFGDAEIHGEAARRHPGKYLQVGLMQRDWAKLPIYAHVWLEPEFYTCLNNNLMDEFFTKTHWKIILIGQEGVGMFEHKDALRSSSWHLHVTGRKWWRVCQKAKCYEEILNEDDNLFYPRDWYHITQCLKMPTITLTSTILTQQNKMALIDELWLQCARGKHGFDFSGKLCDALEVCWHNLDHPVKHWREHASFDLQKVKDRPEAWQSHYDNNKVHGDIAGEEVDEGASCGAAPSLSERFFEKFGSR